MEIYIYVYENRNGIEIKMDMISMQHENDKHVASSDKTMRTNSDGKRELLCHIVHISFCLCNLFLSSIQIIFSFVKRNLLILTLSSTSPWKLSYTLRWSHPSPFEALSMHTLLMA